MQIFIDDKIIKSGFRRHKTNAPEIIRIYYLCNTAFYKKSGVFTLEELADLLYAKGYKSLRPGSGGNRQKKIKQLQLLLNSAPELFIQTKPYIYRSVSKHKIHRYKSSERKIDDRLFHKNNKREFYDLCIGIITDGKTIDREKISKITGYTKAKVCQAVKANDEKGYILKVNNEIVLGSYNNKDHAIKFRLKLFHGRYKIISHIRQYAKQWHIVLPGANSYTSEMLISESGKLQPILKKEHESTVFEVHAQIFNKTICYFKANNIMNNFLNRCCNA